MLGDDGRDLLIVNARLIDGTGAPPRARCAIRVREGIICELADTLELDPSRDREVVLDVGGATVLPGLLDPHIHLQSVPGALHRQDDEDQRRRARHQQLRGYLACGVTTVVDAGVSPEVLRETRSHLDGGGSGPRYLALAPALYPPGGYLDHNELSNSWGPMWGPVGSPADLEQRFAQYEGIEGIVGLKVFMEHGGGERHGWKLHTPEMLQRFVQESEARELPLYVHAIQTRDHRAAVGLRPRGIMHGGFLDYGKNRIQGPVPSDEHIGQLLEAGTYQLTTFSILFDCLLARRGYLSGITDPLIRRAVPADQIRTAEDPRVWRTLWRQLLSTVAPGWVPGWMCALASVFTLPWAGERQLRRDRDRSCQAIGRLVEAGVPIVVGTDSGGAPLFPSAFHGPTTLLEMEALADLGLAPEAVIASATRLPAEMLGIADQVGTVEKGKAADLVVLAEDPLADIRAFRSLQWTIREGQARRPEEWMTESASVNQLFITGAREITT